MMVRLYCRKQEGNDCLCEECRALLEYAHARLEHCPFGERKTSCKHCKIHCYKPGPSPLIALRHLFGDFK